MVNEAQREAVAQALTTALKRATGIALPRAVKNLAWAMEAADEIIAAYEATASDPPTSDEVARVAQELFATPKGIKWRLVDQPQQTQDSYLAQARLAIWAVRGLRYPPPPKDPSP